MKKKIKNYFVDSDVVYWMGRYMPKKEVEILQDKIIKETKDAKRKVEQNTFRNMREEIYEDKS
jgi:DNA-binding protein YbaB